MCSDWLTSQAAIPGYMTLYDEATMMHYRWEAQPLQWPLRLPLPAPLAEQASALACPPPPCRPQPPAAAGLEVLAVGLWRTWLAWMCLQETWRMSRLTGRRGSACSTHVGLPPCAVLRCAVLCCDVLSCASWAALCLAVQMLRRPSALPCCAVLQCTVEHVMRVAVI